MLRRYMVLIGLSAFLLGCATSKYDPAAKPPDAEVAILTQHTLKKEFIFFNVRHIDLIYVDGVSIIADSRLSRLLPGTHSVGVLVDWGDVCLPIPPEGLCFNACYSNVVLEAKAGNIYDYDIERSGSDILVTVADEAGKIVSKGICERCTLAFCGKDQMETINKRIGKKL